ncbi:hypothetical protein [Marinobacter sp. bablab_jr008]|uniref:hypothetical protein n=1 Tax=Marinobacter sp. bablab_jr008 TaxID=2755064 RepID=UPI0018F1E295|nr:hypothetical protein [Marinobacter sp. bablab_jr008]
MLKINVCHCSFLLGLAICPVVALAQPVISGVALTGGLFDGQEVVVRGSGFGDFGGRIISWDDFEQQVVGESVNGSPAKIGVNWSTQYGYVGEAILFDDERAVSGNNSVKIDWSKEPNGSNVKAFGWAGQSPISKIYISYWRFMQGDYNPSDPDNHKQFYLFGSKGEFPQFMPLIPAGQTGWRFYNNVGSSLASGLLEKNSQRWTWENTNSEFQRWEWFVQLNSPIDAYNGIVRGWLDGVLGFSYDDYRVRYVDGTFDDFRLGHMAAGFTDTAKAWFDDIYTATTPARVEICAARIWSECGKTKTIQIPEPDKWHDDSIVVKLRGVDKFSVRSSYLYVVDAEGNVSEPFGLNTLAAPEPPDLKVD